MLADKRTVAAVALPAETHSALRFLSTFRAKRPEVVKALGAKAPVLMKPATQSAIFAVEMDLLGRAAMLVSAHMAVRAAVVVISAEDLASEMVVVQAEALGGTQVL